ncbi:MAG: dynamin family protein [Selenomonadaceae bacterium]|nr:dynamin family protein [Selenomonadaceae bacterium]
MKKVFLQYNPFLIETVITINGKPISHGGELESKCYQRLQNWLYQLFPLLDKECNDDISLQFKGTQLDYNDIVAAVNDYKKVANAVKVELETPILVEGGTLRLKKLIELFDELKNNSPFEDLKDPEIQKSFQKAISTQFEVNVIATMSSGKSTLLNSFLGRELLPSKNEACTATIARIEDVPEMKNFTAVCKNKSGSEIHSSKNLTAQEMDQYNSDENVQDIYIKGNIPFTDDANMQLVLIDTPGPNNSRNEDHQRATYRVIKNESMPMVIYVMNATQLFTNDDEHLFEVVAKTVKEKHGKQARDRFIFAVNKSDMLDPEKGDSVEKIIKTAKEYLADKGIEDANVYPISAEFAKLIRMDRAGQTFTRQQVKNLRNSKFTFEIPEMQFEKYAPLSLSIRADVEADLDVAEADKNVDEVTLIHTGIPSLEKSIVEYMNKYALSNKIKEAVDTFKNKIDEKNLMAQLEESWQKNDAVRQKINQQLQRISAELAKGNEAAKFRERIERMDISKDITKQIRAVRTKCDGGFDTHFSPYANDTVKPEEAQKSLKEMKKLIPNLQADIQTDLEKIVNESIVQSAKKILDEYKSYVHDIMPKSSIVDGDKFFSVPKEILTINLPDVKSIVDKFTRTETYYKTVQVGTKVVSDSKWFKPWTWFREHEEPVWEEIAVENKIADINSIIDEYFYPLRMNMNENIVKIGEAALEQAEEFKAYFVGELDKLDKFIQAKIHDMENTTQSKAELDKKIQQDEDKKVWLNNFKKQLDDVLKV